MAPRRERLETRIERLRKQPGRGDIDDAEYRRSVEETRQMLDALAEGDKVVTFDRAATVVTNLADTLDHLPPARQRDLVRLVVEAVPTLGQGVDVDRMVWTGPVQTLFALNEAPPDGLEPPTQALGRPRSVH